jgi:hypothetical protein
MDQLSRPTDLELLCAIIRAGCDRRTACKLVDVSLDELSARMESDAELRREVLAAEASPEVRHMGNISKAGEEAKQWRASAWWIERRDAQQAAADEADASPTPGAVAAALRQMAELIVAEIPDRDRRQTVLARLLEIAANGAVNVSSANSPIQSAMPAAQGAP